MDREVEWPLPPQTSPTKSGSGTATPEPASKAAQAASAANRKSDGTILRKAALKAASTQKRKAPQDDDFNMSGGKGGSATPVVMDPNASISLMDIDGEGEDEDADGEGDEENMPAHFSKEQEIEKLRTQGSMTQSVHEIARVKNLDKIQMGKHQVEAWYFSPYPVEYAHTPLLYICEFCLSFFNSPKMLSRHASKCTLQHPPGNEVYRWEDITFFEIDGRKQKTWCRNLCLLTKCFLDHKTLYYDVDPFLFYVMCHKDAYGHHMIGFFSKEKESAENYNVACILTLPQHQRKGYGSLLIEFSYELSKKEGKLGSPEKPLSDLGLLSYRAYWAEIIVEVLLTCRDSDISIDEIAQKTAIIHSDVMHTYGLLVKGLSLSNACDFRCQALSILKTVKGAFIIAISDAVIDKHEQTKKKTRRRINPMALKDWKPPQFTRSQLQFGKLFV